MDPYETVFPDVDDALYNDLNVERGLEEDPDDNQLDHINTTTNTETTKEPDDCPICLGTLTDAALLPDCLRTICISPLQWHG